MPKVKYRLSLTSDEREELETVVAKGKHSSKKVINALIRRNKPLACQWYEQWLCQ